MKPAIYIVEQYSDLTNDQLRQMRDEDGDILARFQLSERAKFYKLPRYTKTPISQQDALELINQGEG